MTESLCWYCKLFGKPSRRINFIIVTGAAHSLIYERVKCIFRNDSYISSSTDGIRLRDYKTLTDINDKLFNDGNHSSSIDQAVSTPMEACCNGSTVMPNDIEDVSNSLQLNTFKKQMIELLRSKVEEKSKERRSKSWILLSGSIFLEPPLLNIFLQFTALNSLSSSFTLTVLCFLVKEARLFENWLPHHRSIQDYQEHTFREYDTHIRNFFLLLNSSKYLQDNTLLVDEGTILNDSTLQALMQGLFRKESSKYRASDKQLRADMAKLLSPVQRTIRDIFVTRRDLKSHYHRRAKIRLEPLFHDLQQSSAAVNAARQIANIVLDDFKCMNDGELKAYRKLCVCGFQNHDLENGNTIAAQLVHLAVYLLKNNNDDGSIPLIYSIVLAICEIGAHFYLRHDLFNHTPEIYTLSLLLVSQRQYPITLSGLRLCNTILKADQNEYKYVTNYLTHDPLTARKILNAIIWLLSPNQTLKKIWEESKEEQENEYHASESTKTESAVYISERDCFRHAEILISQSCISNLASLFYGSVDNCMQLTQDDVYQLTEVIDVLTDSRLLACIQGEYHCPPSVVLVSELCALLKPILLYSSPSVCLALINQNNILSTVPKTVQILLQMNEVNKNLINLCINFYIYACLEIKIIQNLSRDSLQCYFMLPSIARTCPLVLATFGIDYIERKGKIEWLHGHNNPETYLNELTQIFRATLDDKDLEVVSAVYATVGLFLPDSFVIDSTTENRIKESKRYWFDSNYPFWVFNNIILLCNEQQDKDASREIRAISALTTLLHKRKHIPFEEAKSIAQKNISKCKAFRSENMASVTCTGATIYSFTDMLFPTDHNYVESIIISIGKNTTIEKDIEKTTRSVIAADRIAEDQIYRHRVKTQDHSQRSRKTINDWKDPSIVDGIEQMRIGQNAEHFFFVYLQNLYGSADVTPTKNWRSSSRLTTYPKYRQTVDDSAGFDFELHDTRQLFVRGSGSTTKLCYFEVKGTSGSFNETHSRFYISQNELYMCQSIVDDSQRREHEAYFIVVIENCLDAEKIAFGTVFNWSDNFHKLDISPETYRCRIISSSLTNVSNSKKEETRDYNNDQQQQRMKTNNRYGNSTTQNVSTKKDDAASRPYVPPYRRNAD
ncbi:unnamed protein product [Rotaria magnacalcarata]|uniref:Protein NO VEIN C-terminal domain-containing protein n=1 Tax=Rotaria magnacalcarata TaxID=392030 RepID=A0A816WWH5_9BILA|nr:unnamed protein product [Rotaria magnacalcarata]CAF4043885.1 unnamed protein product [Rotaria magnacalcarata]